MISLSDEPQFSAEDIYEIPAGVGRTSFEFDTNLIEACHPLFQMYPSNELLAKHLIRDRVILKSDMNLTTHPESLSGGCSRSCPEPPGDNR